MVVVTYTQHTFFHRKQLSQQRQFRLGGPKNASGEEDKQHAYVITVGLTDRPILAMSPVSCLLSHCWSIAQYLPASLLLIYRTDRYNISLCNCGWSIAQTGTASPCIIVVDLLHRPVQHIPV